MNIPFIKGIRKNWDNIQPPTWTVFLVADLQFAYLELLLEFILPLWRGHRRAAHVLLAQHNESVKQEHVTIRVLPPGLLHQHTV